MNRFRHISLAPAAALAAAATTNSPSIDIADFTGLAKITLDASATGGAGQTLDVKIQHSNDNSAWVDAGIAFAQVTNAAASFQVLDLNIDGLRKYIRVVSTVAGATPTVARSVTMVGCKANP